MPTDDSLTAFRDSLNRQRSIDQLKKGDRINHRGTVATIATISIGITYSGLTFVEGASGWMGPSDTMFHLADN